MTIGRAIVCSLIVHLGVVGYGHLKGPAADSVQLQIQYDANARTVEVQQPEHRPAIGDNEQESQGLLDDVDVTAGLKPNADDTSTEADSELQAAPEPEPEPRPEPESEPEPPSEETEMAEADPAPTEMETPEPESESEETSDNRDSVVADEASEAPDETNDTAPTPPEAESGDNEKVASASDGSTDRSGRSSTGSQDGSSDGQGSRSGSPSRDGEGAGGGVDRGELMNGYAESIYELIAEHRTYPKAARRAGLEGTVTVEVKIDRSGRILSVGVHDTSGHKTLDNAAQKALRSIDRLPSPPEALAWNKKRLRIPIRYNLNRHG